MALVFQMTAGGDFYINHDQVVVQEIVSPIEFVLLRSRDGAVIRVREGRSVEIFKGGVRIGGGEGPVGRGPGLHRGAPHGPAIARRELPEVPPPLQTVTEVGEDSPLLPTSKG